jgi:L-ascorbate metabolism protein UlaG (beta-lactamase superfamily)
MRDRSNEGLWAWKQTENNNRLIAFQERSYSTPASGSVGLAFFGGSAFRITSPAGVTIMIDPWRNPPWGNWDWYLYDFPKVEVDIGASTHAHFDHDGLHALSANMLLDRLAGEFVFADVKITGIADKHVSDSSHSVHDWAAMTRKLTQIRTDPPDNWRCFDNSLIVVETGGLRILHWGDNRPNPPERVWNALGTVDVALLPIDSSEHVLSYAQVDTVISRLSPKIVVPHHYYIWDVTTRGSTLLPADAWVKSRPNARWADSGAVELVADDVKTGPPGVLYFAEHVAFQKPSTNENKTGA